MSMESLIKIFGAKASIHVKYEGDLPSLATKLSSALMLRDFQINQREEPPYDVVGTSETLGWELWLQRNDTLPTFHYSLRMETEHSIAESFNDQMHDLSPWLARYVSLTCDVEALVAGTSIVFDRGKVRRLAEVETKVGLPRKVEPNLGDFDVV